MASFSNELEDSIARQRDRADALGVSVPTLIRFERLNDGIESAKLRAKKLLMTTIAEPLSVVTSTIDSVVGGVLSLPATEKADLVIRNLPGVGVWEGIVGFELNVFGKSKDLENSDRITALTPALKVLPIFGPLLGSAIVAISHLPSPSRIRVFALPRKTRLAQELTAQFSKLKQNSLVLLRKQSIPAPESIGDVHAFSVADVSIFGAVPFRDAVGTLHTVIEGLEPVSHRIAQTAREYSPPAPHWADSIQLAKLQTAYDDLAKKGTMLVAVEERLPPLKPVGNVFADYINFLPSAVARQVASQSGDKFKTISLLTELPGPVLHNPVAQNRGLKRPGRKVKSIGQSSPVRSGDEIVGSLSARLSFPLSSPGSGEDPFYANIWRAPRRGASSVLPEIPSWIRDHVYAVQVGPRPAAALSFSELGDLGETLRNNSGRWKTKSSLPTVRDLDLSAIEKATIVAEGLSGHGFISCPLGRQVGIPRPGSSLGSYIQFLSDTKLSAALDGSLRKFGMDTNMRAILSRNTAAQTSKINHVIHFGDFLTELTDNKNLSLEIHRYLISDSGKKVFLEISSSSKIFGDAALVSFRFVTN